MHAGLVYVSDSEPGIARIRRGKGFSYLDLNGKTISTKSELARIKALAVPPAYRNVWICADANGHIQATGLDEANRKQYRYHPLWSEAQSGAKFDKLSEFGRKVPQVRRVVESILSNAKKNDVFAKEVATAAVVRLLDHTAMRIGGRSRTSQGATTLLLRNIRYDKDKLRLQYTAKGGKKVRCSVSDKRLQRILEKIHDLPGKRLFQYIGIDGEVHPLDSGDVNNWLKDLTGVEHISAKMFRTWHGSVAALEALRKANKPSIRVACEAASCVLWNTPAIARKSYVHPAVLDLAATDDPAQALAALSIKRRKGLTAAEQRLMALITADPA
ncbi:DNA topoisomerase IB [Sphingorhabdus sp.]|uniref:DNA topoisomerase IB n=1 Tax=Sphingorhabdus sp. TaxID=1902408 RepID=UPI00391ABB3E